jgi:hypothetical protein
MATAETVGGDLVVLAVAWPWCRCASPRLTLVELGGDEIVVRIVARCSRPPRRSRARIRRAGDGSE